MTRSTATAFGLAALLAAASSLHSGTAQAQRDTVGCTGPNDTLQQPYKPGINLKITKACKVTAGTYLWGNVHVLKGGTLDFADDGEIHFWASNILVENEGTLSAGTPTDPIGKNGGTVTIHLWGADANKAGTLPDAKGLGVLCLSDTSAAPCGIPEALWKSNVEFHGGIAMPKPPAEAVKISTVTFPAGESYPPGRTDDYFYAYAPLFFDGAASGTNVDGTPRVGYFGYKALAISYGGSLKLFGRKGTYDKLDPNCMEETPLPSSERSWARLAGTVTPNDAPVALVGRPGVFGFPVKLDRRLTLKAGDEIVVTTTDYLPGHSEKRIVAQDANCSDSILVTRKFDYIHNGERYPLTAVANSQVGLDPKLQAAGADTRAAVGVLTRSIRIVSGGDNIGENFPDEPAWTADPPSPPGYYFGGHVIARQGFKTFQVQGVEFHQLGQGGKLGHYPVHFHHARQTSTTPETFVRDSSIHESMTRWIVLHGTQDVKLERNVGYKSIGHGFYLEDGTEINNTLVANLGVFARAAVDNPQNPRKVPGILAAPDLHTSVGKEVEYRSDYAYPTVFWIMNGWNVFRDNMAAGAGTCGVCYWLVPGYNSGMSQDMKWASYASMQSVKDRGGMTPLQSFVGNTCTTAMTSFQTINETESCQGIGPGDAPLPHLLNLPPIRNPLAARKDPPPGADAETVAKVVAAANAYYPKIAPGGGRFATKCDKEDCSTEPGRCGAGAAESCMVTVLDRYTTSFNWAPFNFAAIWLRPQWFLVTDSVITDVQQAGLTMVTGGGYSESDVVPGHWALVRKSVFIGNTQDCPTCKIKTNPFASNGGPFNPDSGLRCANDKDGNRPGAYCLNIAEGVSHQMSNFGMYQRLFSVYDGPAFQDSNAYLNITTRPILDCEPHGDVTTGGTCDPPNLAPVPAPDKPRQSAWIAGYVLGLPKKVPPAPAKPFCYMPNAAIGWKQPNGFYYPPAFHSLNLFFDNVDTRHFVVSPPFLEGTYTPDTKQVADTYCIWPISNDRKSTTLFTGFAGNDRQTVLNDDDGTLAGYKVGFKSLEQGGNATVTVDEGKGTTIINLDPFFAAPVDATQCRSDGSSRTSPFEYVTTVIYPACVIDGSCARAPIPEGQPGYPNERLNDGDWNRACTSEQCYGIPLWRQDLMPIADKGVAKSIRMMGQETAQRSSLTVNHGTYYFDTTVDKDTQLTSGCTGPNCVVNLFKKNETYYLFLIFAKENTEQRYRFYVGDPSFDLSSIKMVRGDIGKNPIVWDAGKETALQPGRARWYKGDSATGVVEVDIKLKDVPGIADAINAAEIKKCQPSTFCKWDPDYVFPGQDTPAGRCRDLVPLPGKPAGDNSVCQWANADLDCPDDGCVGIKFTLPNGFSTRKPGDGRPDPRPVAECVPKPSPTGKNTPWNSVFVEASDGTCPQPADLKPEDFCQ